MQLASADRTTIVPTYAVESVRDAVEQARFEAAEQQARALLASDTLDARTRNDTLELLAIAQIAARHEADARTTLTELFARDPDHVPRLRDPGPAVEALFTRIRAEAPSPRSATLRVTASRDARARLLVEVDLGEGRDAVDTVHVFARGSKLRARAEEPRASASGSRAEEPRASAFGSRAEEPRASTLEERSLRIEPVHVVADRGSRSHFTLALPPIDVPSRTLEVYVEARAPSGYPLALAGTEAQPLRIALQPDLLQPDPPLRQKWWLWTSLAITVAGVAITSAIVGAH